MVVNGKLKNIGVGNESNPDVCFWIEISRQFGVFRTNWRYFRC